MKPLFNRLAGRHLDDASLAAIWTSMTAAGASVTAGASDPHLASCGECRVRYDAFASWMEEIRTDARLEADEIFTPERLAAQQAVITRRLEAAERPARVIAFPKFSSSTTGRSAPVRRWIAAAAAAGLLVGLGLGQIMDLRHFGDRRTFPGARTGSAATRRCHGTRRGPGERRRQRGSAAPRARGRRDAAVRGASRLRDADAEGSRLPPVVQVTVSVPQPVIFRKGLDMKEAVAGELSAAYDSALVDKIRDADFIYNSGRLTVHLAREFGFCYGVDRAVDYAYQARRRFPGRNVFLTGEIIHNPHVNDRLRAQGIRFLSDPHEQRETLGPEDVVILPAFGVTVADMAQFTEQGCTLVDTTCGSVLNVWKNVTRYAREGFTSVIHGKVRHEETRATASQALKFPGGHYLVVLDRDEAGIACDYIRRGTDREAFFAPFLGGNFPRFRPGSRSGPGRLREPDDDADV